MLGVFKITGRKGNFSSPFTEGKRQILPKRENRAVAATLGRMGRRYAPVAPVSPAFAIFCPHSTMQMANRLCEGARRVPVFPLDPCESGEIGRRTRLRIWRGNPWGFESPLSHQDFSGLFPYGMQAYGASRVVQFRFIL